MKRVSFVSMIVLCVLCVTPSFATPLSYSGFLSSQTSGLIVGGAWSTAGEIRLDWTVSQKVNQDDVVVAWHYYYKLTIPDAGGAISHFSLERSAESIAGEFFNFCYMIDDEVIDLEDMVALFGIGQEGPSDFHQIKFESIDLDDVPDLGHVFILEFDSIRVPIWGDFYAKNGYKGGMGLNEVWNAGFTNPDTDPAVPLSDGSVDYHLIVPDTAILPVPGAVLLGSLGVGLIGWFRRRRCL